MLPAVSRSAVARTVGVEIVVLPGTPRDAVWKLASPDWIDSAVRCSRETGFCELSRIVMRLSGRTLITPPSARWISAVAPDPVFTRSFCRSTTARVAEAIRAFLPAHLYAALDLDEAGAVSTGRVWAARLGAKNRKKARAARSRTAPAARVRVR
jgi:hypothetical protein